MDGGPINPAFNPASLGIGVPNPSGKPGFIGPFPLVWDVSGGLKIESLGIANKMVCYAQIKGGKEGGFADKLIKAIQSIPDELKQKMASAGVTQCSTSEIVGRATFTDIVGSNPDRGGRSNI